MDKDPYTYSSAASEEDLGSDDPFIVTSTPSSKRTHVIKLLAPIEHDNLTYAPVLNVLEGASQNDDVILQLAGPGGSVDTGIVLVNAIRDCKARVNVVVIGRCFSMHALLAVSGDSLVMKPNTWLMFHNYSGGEYGKGTEMFDATIQTYKHIHEFFDDIATPFLSDTEIQDVKKDKDVYVKANDSKLKARIKRHFDEH